MATAAAHAADLVKLYIGMFFKSWPSSIRILVETECRFVLPGYYLLHHMSGHVVQIWAAVSEVEHQARI